MKNTYKNRHQLFSIITFCLVTILVSCTEWDEYKKYTKNGEIIYVGKFDSAFVFSGKERIRFWGKLTRDPKIKKCKIFWDNFQDSVEFNIDGLGNTPFDEIVAVEEGTKSFTVINYDDQGNSSMSTTVTGKSYGARYRNTLSNRRIKSMDYDKAATIIYWDLIDEMLGPVQMEVSYKTPFGDTLVITPATETTTTLKGLDFKNDGFTWRTVFSPDETSIDTFCTKYNTRGIPTFAEKELDRSSFKAVSLAGDASGNGGAGGVKAMWDGKPQNSYDGANFTDIGSGGSSPQMVTFDLGMNTQLSKLVLYPFQEWWGSYYVFSTIREYEIYGSANPTSNGALDGSWTLLASGTITKPSGGPKDNESAADKAAAVAGFTLNVDANAPKVRYIRIRCLKNYESFFTGNSNAFFSIAEIRAFGMLPQ